MPGSAKRAVSPGIRDGTGLTVSEESPEGPRDVAAGSRERILSVALRHFARYGYGQTNLRQVAAEAGVTTGPMYHHFSSKRDLYREVGIRALKGMMEIYEEVGRPGLAPSRRGRMEAFFERLDARLTEVEDWVWLGIQMEFDAARYPAVAFLRTSWAPELERVFALAAGCEPQTDADGSNNDPLVVLMLALAYGQARGVVRHGPEALALSLAGLKRLLAQPRMSDVPS